MVNSTLVYGEENHQFLNVIKTCKLITDFWKKAPQQHPRTIRVAEGEMVDSHRFLGLHVSSHLSEKGSEATTLHETA